MRSEIWYFQVFGSCEGSLTSKMGGCGLLFYMHMYMHLPLPQHAGLSSSAPFNAIKLPMFQYQQKHEVKVLVSNCIIWVWGAENSWWSQIFRILFIKTQLLWHLTLYIIHQGWGFCGELAVELKIWDLISSDPGILETILPPQHSMQFKMFGFYIVPKSLHSFHQEKNEAEILVFNLPVLSLRCRE